MKHKRLTLFCSICLVLVLLASLVLAACAKEEAAPGAPTRITPQVPTPATPTTPATPAPAKPAPAPEAEVLKWRMQTWVPSSMAAFSILCQGFTDGVREASDGRIDITAHSTGELVANTDILDACAKGVFEISMTHGAYYKGVLPIADIAAGLPGTFRKNVEGDIFFYDLGFIDLLREAYATQGIRYISPLTSGGFAFLSKLPITSIDDFNGMKIRTVGYTAELVEALGAATVYVPVDEIYMALATGVVDAASFGDIFSMYDLKFHEVTQYYSQPNVLFLDWNVSFMNLDIWETLPKDLQAILFYVAQERGANFGRLSEYGAAENLAIVMKDHGIEVNQLPASDVNKMAEVSMSIWEKLAEKDEYCAKAITILKDYLRLLGYID